MTANVGVSSVNGPMHAGSALKARTRRPDARLIAVAIREVEADATLVDWTVAEADSATDLIDLVHVYEPLQVTGCVWEPVERERNVRTRAESRVTNRVVQRLRAARPGLDVQASTVAGEPAESLLELSRVVDLLVVGDRRSAPSWGRRFAWYLQDIAACPVIGVPPAWRAASHELPVTVVIDDRGLTEAPMRFAAEVARRRASTLRVSRTWSSLREGEGPSPVWLAHQQEAMDTQLAGWRARYPALPMVARIELGPSWCSDLGRASSLLVTGRHGAERLRSGAARGELATCPIAVVP